jgi:hypothetical protein
VGNSAQILWAQNQPREAFLEIESDATAEQIRWLEYAAPFFKALEQQNYKQIYEMLSPHAKARVSLDEIMGEKQGDGPVVQNATLEQFVGLMQQLESKVGKPGKILFARLGATDPQILSGQIAKSGDRWHVAAVKGAIGQMSDKIPAEIRRASIKGKANRE